MNIHLSLAPLIALVAGILILLGGDPVRRPWLDTRIC